MSFVHGLNSKIKLGNGAPSSLMDISGAVNSISRDRSRDTVETTTLNATAKTHLVGLPDGTYSAEGFRDSAIEAHLEDAFNFTGPEGVEIEYYPEGEKPGASKSVAKCHVTAFNESSGIDAAVAWTLEFQVTGSQTREVIS